MNKLLLLFNLCLVYNLAWSQTPFMNTPTVIPQSPTSADVIKIITKITTPNQSVVVDQTSFSVNQNPKEINISACYLAGMLPATQDFIDTLVIGQLAAGTYAIKHKAFMSSGQQICHKTDSNQVTLNLEVAILTGLKQHQESRVSIFPNPATDKVYIVNSGFLKATLYSTEGSLLKTIELKNEVEIDIHDLCKGLYFMNFSNDEQQQMQKFIKN